MRTAATVVLKPTSSISNSLQTNRNTVFFRSKFSASWRCSTRVRPIGRSSSSTSTIRSPLSSTTSPILRGISPGFSLYAFSVDSFIQATRDWFRKYKVPAGKPPNNFAFGGEFKDRDFALQVVEETHEFWKHLIRQPSPQFNT